MVTKVITLCFWLISWNKFSLSCCCYGFNCNITFNTFLKNLFVNFINLLFVLFGFKIALAGSNIAFIKAKSPPGIISGVLLQAINPKAYVVNTTLVSGFAFYQSSFAIELVIKFFIMNSIWIPLHYFGYMLVQFCMS